MEENYPSEIKIPEILPNDDYHHLLSTLNTEQQMFVYEIGKRERNRLFCQDNNQNFAFLSGGAGSVKSVALKAVYQFLLRLFQRADNFDPAYPAVIIAAYTATAARNVGGSTIHTTLGLKFGTNCFSVNSELSASTLQSYRTKLQNVKVLLIDEASYVGCRTLYRMDQRLRAFTQVDKPFGGISVIFFGDLFQLKPVKDAHVFAALPLHCLPHAAFYVSPWSYYEMFELTTIMRQTDTDWVQLLNRIRLGVCSDNDLDRIKKLVGNSVPDGTHRACHLKKNAQEFNKQHFLSCSNVLISVAQWKISQSSVCTKELVDKLLTKAIESSSNDISSTGGLLFSLPLAMGQRYMITSNVDKEDGLVNGAIGFLKDVSTKSLQGVSRIELIWLELEDRNAGASTRKKYLRTHSTKVTRGWTPVEKVVRDFAVPLSNRLGARVRMEWKQIPVSHAQGVTIHKFQGVTQDHLELCFESKLKVHGLAYVALSRCRTESGNSIVRPITPKDIKVDEDVIHENKRMQGEHSNSICDRFLVAL